MRTISISIQYFDFEIVVRDHTVVFVITESLMLKLFEHQVIGIVGDQKDNARLFRIFRVFSETFFQIQ